MRLPSHCLLLASGLLAGPALAEDLEGLVRVAGSGINQELQLTPGTEVSGPVVCMDETGKKVKKLGAMVVKVSGEWKLNKKGEKTCFQPQSFAVVKVSSGRDAVVGTLSQKNGTYVVTSDDGKARPLDDVSSGLKKLEGQKVILDVKPMETPQAKEAVYKVVSYAVHP